MDYQVIRYKSPLSETDHIFIPEINFHCYPQAPSGKYELIEFLCPKCLDITVFFVVETKKGNKLFNYGTKFLSLFCTVCDYSGKFETFEKEDNVWEQLKKTDLHNTAVDFSKNIDTSEREKLIQNLKKRYRID